MPGAPLIIILMGPAGAGKTTVGSALATALGWPFHDGDTLHPPGNIDRMRRGVPLTDADRVPWLAAVRRLLVELAQRQQNAVVACSALRAAYRATLDRQLPEVRWVFLDAAAHVLRRRLVARTEHFAGATLLDSQLAALERPADAVTVSADRSVPAIVDEICRTLHIPPGTPNS